MNILELSMKKSNIEVPRAPSTNFPLLLTHQLSQISMLRYFFFIIYTGHYNEHG